MRTPLGLSSLKDTQSRRTDNQACLSYHIGAFVARQFERRPLEGRKRLESTALLGGLGGCFIASTEIPRRSAVAYISTSERPLCVRSNAAATVTVPSLPTGVARLSERTGEGGVHARGEVWVEGKGLGEARYKLSTAAALVVCALLAPLNVPTNPTSPHHTHTGT